MNILVVLLIIILLVGVPYGGYYSYGPRGGGISLFGVLVVLLVLYLLGLIPR